MRRPRRDPAQDPDDVDAAEAVALRILTGAGQSSVGLQQRLRQRGFSAMAAGDAVERCRVRGYIDDGALAESLAGRLRRSGHGRARVAAELRARGIGEKATSSALESLGADEEERALEVGRRLFQREIRRGDDGGMRRRLAASLQRRGFSAGTIAGTLRALSAEAATTTQEPS